MRRKKNKAVNISLEFWKMAKRESFMKWPLTYFHEPFFREFGSGRLVKSIEWTNIKVKEATVDFI